MHSVARAATKSAVVLGLRSPGLRATEAKSHGVRFDNTVIVGRILCGRAGIVKVSLMFSKAVGFNPNPALKWDWQRVCTDD